MKKRRWCAWDLNWVSRNEGWKKSDQMVRLFLNIWQIHNKQNMPNSIIVLPKQVHSFAKY